MTNLHISISAEPVFYVGQYGITNSMVSTWLVMAFLIITTIVINQKFKNRQYSDKPDRFQTLFEFIIEAFLNLTKTTAGSYKKTRVLFPLVTTLFLFIMISNWSGLLPGNGTIGINEAVEVLAIEESTANNYELTAETVSESISGLEDSAVIVEESQLNSIDNTGDSKSQKIVEDREIAPNNSNDESTDVTSHTKFVPLFRAPTADLNTTLALALFSVLTIQFMGIKHLGLIYFQKYINFQSPIAFFIGMLEIISEISKIVSFAFRLFGNIFAGEVLLSVMAALLPILAPLPFLGLEIFVGFIQALVFAMLTLVFMNMATVSHEEH